MSNPEHHSEPSAAAALVVEWKSLLLFGDFILPVYPENIINLDPSV
jgi:hypothetical protein